MSTRKKATETERDQFVAPPLSRSTISSHPPASLRNSVTLWLLAIGAGVFETVLVIVNTVLGDGRLANGEDIGFGLAVRVAIFAIMTMVALKVLQGKNWARPTIGIGLGIFGLLSLLIQPISWLAQGHSPGEAFTNFDLTSAAFMLSRAIHMLAVVAAAVLMYAPGSNAYFSTLRNRKI